MDLPFSFRQKIKIAMFLFCIMACTLIIRILEDKSIKIVGSAFSSLYNDRLVPATDLFQISEQVYAKKHLIETYFDHSQRGVNQATLVNKLAFFEKNIDSLLRKYQNTYLVEKEKEGLLNLKGQLNNIQSLEYTLFTNQVQSAEIERVFNDASISISHLIKIQSKAGQELALDAQKNIGASKIYSGIQLALAILIGVLILSILLTANILKVKTDNFSLN